MNSLDAELIRNLRREFGKRPVDTTRLDIQVTNGRVSLGGMLGRLRDQPTVSVEEELAKIEKMFVRHPLVKSYTSAVRIMKDEDNDKDHGDSRGRIRHQ
ncbi:hypothetical protein CCAX7_42360 [Capsulimonas corticalis]|uniref:Uncharacterized protein n=1 Tax=Capsulimonas corticalis TaxID=2219043 RepID=A0A402CXW3_9BACT|nr:hypothetical protein [Capsulimonas corticalis]BDI32185.1 hypothetical protein CCAX7_42360 [Capsulimonas corticalis]